MFRKWNIRRILGTVSSVGVAGCLLLLGSLWLEHRTATILPVPTGTFAVARAMYAWGDNATPDKLVVWIWYPAAASQSAATAPYLPDDWRSAFERHRGPFDSNFLTRDLSKVHTHSLPDAGVSLRQQVYPVVILRGGASSEVTNYSSLAEDLASHGYVVVGLDAPYRTNVIVFPDGRVMHRIPENNPELCLERQGGEQSACVNKLLLAWTADMAFVLDRLELLNKSDGSGRFTGRLDLTRVGVFGHSFGGAQAAQFCHDDSRCKAAIDLDGAPFGSVVGEGLHQPFLFVLSDQIHNSDAESREVLANIQSIYDHLPADGRLRIVIRGANHFLFSDDGALLKSHFVMRALRALGIIGIDGRRQLAVTAYCIRSFFDAYLKRAKDVRLVLGSPLYPEIQQFD